MTYATQADLVARFGSSEVQQLSDINNTGAIDATRVSQMLADASNTIDGYLASRYTLPLSEPPPMLNVLCCDVARYLLAVRPTEETSKRWEKAIAWLMSVAKGTIDLGGATADAQPISGGPEAEGNRRVFGERELRDFNHPIGLP